MAASIPEVAAPAETLTGVGVPVVGWFCQHWSTYPVAEDPPIAEEALKHTS